MIKKIIKQIVDIIYKILGILFNLFPIDTKKVVVSNFWGKGYNDNPKYVIEKLHKMYPEIKIVWLLKDMKTEMPQYIKKVKYKSIKSIYEYSTAIIWIDNSRKQYFPPKRKKQKYIQLWHGGISMKKIEAAAADKLDNSYIKMAKKDSKAIDYAISNSSYRTNIFKNDFWYNGKILEYGSPRNDIYFSKELKKKIKDKICKEYNVKDKKIILYIPTFRAEKNFDYLSINFEKLIQELKKEKEDYIVMIKLHPNCGVKKKIIKDNMIIFDSSVDVNELMISSDMIISDYSSVIFDYLYMKNPIYLYVPDIQNYINERGFSFNYNELPFSKSTTSDELIKKILSKDHLNYDKKLNEFLNKISIYDDGNAADRIVELIEKILKEV